MRGKSTSKARSTEVTENKHKLDEPLLSGAYIRSLVKQLSSSRLKDRDHTEKNRNSPPEDPQPLPPPPPHPPKKQVRRRLHTSRPYQERLLNMAEARREIVTALKFHRASMKQANEQQQYQQLLLPNPNPNPNPNLYVFPNYNQAPLPFQYPCWPYTQIAPLPNITDNFNLPFPNQPLGLNLNLQGFNTINSTPPPIMIHPISSLSSSSSSSSFSPTEVPPVILVGPDAGANPSAMKLHQAMDEEEMAEIRTIGERHDIEWNDTMNLVNSAWWGNFLETMEEGNMDIPTWLGDSSEVMQQLDDYYLQDTSLPCFDIGEIEGLEGDQWLS